MAKEKGVYTGIIEKDENGNYFCGEYLLDYQYTEASFKLGDEINIKTIIPKCQRNRKTKLTKS